MLVSIITVTKNSSATICDTIKSIQAQSYPFIEHIIVDGSSNDNTIQTIKNCNHKGPLISENDNGLYFAMNKGIEIANGDIIGILNSDDFLYDNNVIEKMVAEFKRSDCDAAYSDLIFVDRKNTSIVKRKWIAGIYDVKKFELGWMPPHPTFYAKKEMFKKFGVYNTDLKCSADYDLLLRFMYVHRIHVHY